MANPFTHPPSTRVLNPCENASDLDLYVNIDNQQECITRVDRELERTDLVGEGMTLLIHGKTGCGKSALANRIAHGIRERFHSAARRVVVVNLDPGTELLGLTLDAKVRSTLQKLCAILRRAGVPGPDVQVLEQQVDEPALFVTLLDEMLDRVDALVVVIFAPFELHSELDAAVRMWRRRRIVSIFSTASPGVAQRSERSYGTMSGTPVVQLKIGPLRVEDGWAIVEDRTFRVEETKRLAVDRRAVDEYMKQRLPGSEVSVREFQRTCLAVFDRAIEEGRAEITFEDFAKYWVRVGRQ